VTKDTAKAQDPGDPDVELTYQGPSGSFDYHGTAFRIGEPTTVPASVAEEIHAAYGADHSFIVLPPADAQAPAEPAADPEPPTDVPPGSQLPKA
jgi:hypothetical protein